MIKILFSTVVLLFFSSCATSFLTKLPNGEIAEKADHCSISAINVEYFTENKVKISDQQRNVVVGFNTEIIKQTLKENNVYCDVSKKAEVLNIIIKEGGYYRFAGIKTRNRAWAFFSGLSIGIIPYSIHQELEIIAKTSSNNKQYKSTGSEVIVFSTPLFFLAPFNVPTKNHTKLMKYMINDICDQMKRQSF